MFDQFVDVSNRQIKNKFNANEDKTILYFVNCLHISNWKIIAANLQGRSPRQVIERYRHYLKTGISMKPWSTEEDEILEKKVQEFGPHWCKIAEFLPGRTNVNIKNRWTVISKKKNKRQNCKSAKISLPQPVPENSVTSPDDFKDFENYTVEMAF